MAKTLGATPVAAAAAVRARRPGWRDPRLWLGVAIVAVSVIAGARLLARADDTMPVWALRSGHPAGAVVRRDDLTVHRVRFADVADLGDYFAVGDQLPERLPLTRAVGAGELLPRGAVGAARASGLAQLPVAVEASGVPTGLTAGSAVDVYVVGRPAAAGGPAQTPRPRVRPVLSDVTVVDVASDDLGGPVTLTLAVPADDVASYFASTARADDPVVTVVGRP